MNKKKIKTQKKIIILYKRLYHLYNIDLSENEPITRISCSYGLKEQLKSFTYILLYGTYRSKRKPLAEDLQKACYSVKNDL